MRTLAAMGLLLLLASCLGQRQSAPDVDAPVAVALAKVVDGLDQPVHVWFDDEDPDHLYVVEQPGRVFRIDLEGAERTIALDVTDRVGSGGERGLFAVAFQAGRMFVHYTDRAGDTVVSSFALRNGSADPDSEAVFLRQAQPHANHNGGQIAFHEGHLFIGLGDGGGAGDPDGNGQDLSTLLAKILRIDVGNGTEYAVPNDNPFVGRADARPEVWAYGLRNPWRFSFDRETGDLFIGDVGQNRWEEIDLLRDAQPAGANFGWSRFEGRESYRGRGGLQDHVGPIHQYATGPGGTCAVTGGHVYRGQGLPGLRGVYVFADYCGGKVWGLVQRGDGFGLAELLSTGLAVSSFGEDARGELYLTDRGGGVYRFTDG